MDVPVLPVILPVTVRRPGWAGPQPFLGIVAHRFPGHRPVRLDPPGRAGLPPGPDQFGSGGRVTGRRRTFADHVVPLRGQALDGAEVADPLGARADLFRGRRPGTFADRVGQPAVVAGGAGHRPGRRPAADHPDRDPRPLYRRRRWHEVTGRDPVMGALELVRLPRPQPGQHLEPLVEQLRADLPARVGLEGQPAGVRGAEPDRQDEPAAGQVVQGGGLAGHVPGTAARQRGQHGAQADPGGGHRRRGQRDPGVHAPDRLPDEEAVPAVALGERGEVRGGAGIPPGKNEAVPHRLRP